MRRILLAMLLAVGVTAIIPATGYAQESTFTGTVTDSTGAVLPGVTVTATHAASGNTFVGVTDERGAFRIAVRAGAYTVTAELQGFATVTRSGLDLLVGQSVAANLQLQPAGLTESVTVTGEAPLIDVSSSSLGGNIDPKQMSELPVNGRNWQDLVALAPGARTNAVGSGSASSEQPTPGGRRGASDFQVTMDGQEVTNNQCCRGQPSFSKDAIAEFQFLSSRFDATQGRSAGVQVNVITKAGSNTYSGSVSGYFRDDKFKSPDFFSHTVLPYSNQQSGGTFGGPIIRDRLHFFSNFEYEREPQSFNYNTPYPTVNAIVLTGTRDQKMGGARIDYQISPSMRFMIRSNLSTEYRPYEGTDVHPAASEQFWRSNQDAFATLTQVLSNRTLNEVKVGFAGFTYHNQNRAVNPKHPQAFNGITLGGPRITFSNYSIGGNTQVPQGSSENKYSVRDDFTISFNKGGRHDIKTGGEYFYMIQGSRNCRNCMGVIDARKGAPTPAQFAAWFPVWDDVSTWNMNAISPLINSYTLGVGVFSYNFDREMPNVWFQDDWAVTSKLTLNLGIRYEEIHGAWMNSVELLPFLEKDRSNDNDNVGPRLGFTYALNDKTVVRGGFGQYYGYPVHNVMSFTISHANIASVQIFNDGRADFGGNPFNGPIPTFDQLKASFCSNNGNKAGCLQRGGLTQLAPPEGLGQVPHSWQSSIGVGRQIGNLMSFEADYTFNGSRRERVDTPNVNVAYDRATGINIPTSVAASRPFPEWGLVAMYNADGESNYHALQTAFTKRMSNNYQLSATYTYSKLYSRDPMPLTGVNGKVVRVDFPLAKDLGGDYGLSENDQRHRAVLNGIWQMPYGLQLSGLYFFGSGERFSTTYGGDRRGLGTAGFSRLRPDGSIAPRNALVGDPVHRVDMRVQKRFGLGGARGFDAIFELFNVFNHENYGAYTTAESNPLYGQPAPIAAVAYQPRQAQFAFRFAF